MARGLPRPEAEALMVQAFVGEAMELVENEELREVLNSVAETWLQARTKS
jgi:Fe-S cluster assembly protein SufD